MRIKRVSKTLSLFLAFCMVFTMLPTEAFAKTFDVETGTAEDELDPPEELKVTVTSGSAIATTESDKDTATDSEVQDTPALLSMRGAESDAFQVEGGATYATLEEAASAVMPGGTIIMLKDVIVTKPLLVNNEIGIRLNFNKSYTIDFGGHKLSSYDNSKIKDYLLWIEEGSVTLRNGTIRANYDAAQKYRPEALYVTTTVNIYDMNIVSSYETVTSLNDGNITIWSGRFETFGGNLTPLNEWSEGKIVLAEDSTVDPASKWKNESVKGGVVTVTAAADVILPSPVSVKPWHSNAQLSGNLVIEFSEWMDRKTAGTVRLNSLAVLTDGVWKNSTTYTIPYSGLEYSTTYAINISGFKDEAGNTMVDVAGGWDFTFTNLSSDASKNLKEALRSPIAAEITIDSNITLDEVVELGASHTLIIPAAYTLILRGNGAIKTSGKTLTINGGGTVTVAKEYGPGLGGSNESSCEDVLNLENITVNLQNSVQEGIRIQTVNVGNGATINLDATGTYLIVLNEGYTLNVNSNGKINIKNFDNVGIINYGGTVHINGGEIAVGTGQGLNYGICNEGYYALALLKISDGGRLSGTDDSRIRLYEGSKVEGVNGTFKDRGMMFNTEGISTVGAAIARPSESTLSDGRYIWDDNIFVKEGIILSALPQNATVAQGKITGSLSVKATADIGAEVSYEWSRAEWNDTEDRWKTGTSIPGAISDSYLIPSDLTVGKYGFYVTVSAPGCLSVSTRNIMATVTVKPPDYQAYTATLHVNVDDAPFNSHIGSYTLKLEGDESTEVTMIGTGDTRTADVENGTWKVYDSSNNYTGVNITVKNGSANGTLDYYTVNYSVIKQGTASDGRINLSAVSLGGDFFNDIASASSFLKGNTLTFTASGEGAANYTYEWSGTHNGNIISGTNNTYTIDSVQGKVGISCTITGINTTPTTIEITGFEAIPDKNAGEAGSATYANATEVITSLSGSAMAIHTADTVTWPVSTWVDTDGYNPTVAGSYTFTATLGTAPTGYTNSGSYTATVEVVVSASSSIKQVATAEELKTELEKTVAQTIEITDSFIATEPIFMASNHELRIPADKTLTFSGKGKIRFGANGTTPAHTLTINGGGKLVLGCTGISVGISGSNGTLNLSNIHITVKSDVGIGIKCLNVGDGATITSEGEEASTIISLSNDSICTVNTGGLIDIRDYDNTGIQLQGSTLHINGGTVTFGMNDRANRGISFMEYGAKYGSLKYTSGTLSSSNGVFISINQGTNVEGLGGIFSDQNHILGTSDPITVGKYNAAPSTNGLTAGNYYWDDERFAKHVITISAQPQDMLVTAEAIDDSLSVSCTASNGKTVTYQWMKANQNSILGLSSKVQGATSNTFTIPTDLTEGSYYYYCILSEAECFPMTSDIVTVTVNAPEITTPTITITKHPQNVSVTQGRINETLTAEAVASNSKSVLYQWYRFIGGIGSDNVETINGATSNTLTIPTNLTAGTYKYHCFFSADGINYTGSNMAIVTVNQPYSGGNDSGSYTPPAPTPSQAPPNQPVTRTMSVTATEDANGTAGVNIPENIIDDIIAKAQADARVQGNTAKSISIGMNVTMPRGASSLTATLTQGSLDSLVSAGVSQFELNGAPVSLGLDLIALQEIQRQGGGDIRISITSATGLSAEVRALFGNRPVYDISISYVKGGKTIKVTSLGTGKVTLIIPYKADENETVGCLFGLYVDEEGKAQRIPGSVYDANMGSLLIPSDHLSVYGIGYTTFSDKYKDIASHWAKESIDYVLGRGLIGGDSLNQFSPDLYITRGALVTALGRMAEVDINKYTTSSFNDIKAGTTYSPYIEWACEKGIIKGISNDMFAANMGISREEVALVLQNYAAVTDYKLPITREMVTYVDDSSISDTYRDAVKAMQQAGIMMGRGDNMFNPRSRATRAEVSCMLHRYIKLIINPATAQGWDNNDAGQSLYYKEGIVVTDK